MEYGIVLPQHMGQLRRGLPEVLEDESNELTALGRRLLASWYSELSELDEKIERIEKEPAGGIRGQRSLPADSRRGRHRAVDRYRRSCRDERRQGVR